MDKYKQDEEILGWCTYCKNNIKYQDAHVVRGENIYHLDCYRILEREKELLDKE